jgi:POT family proton-dependent oligopeptide transporter
MADKKEQAYASAPQATDKMPGGIPYIIGNEAAERFSFYGMKAILVIFMTKYLMDSSGYADVMSGAEARTWYHFFTSAVYFTPIFGAIIADYFLGKYKTILSLSIVYCLGHLALALDETRFGLTLGLTLIAIGAGGIKPCVSAHVGDQFGKKNHHLLEKVFGWFYFSINLGAFSSSLLTPVLLKAYGPSIAFGIPGGLMLLATWVFWLGRGRFIHIPAGGKDFVKEVFSGDGLKSVSSLFLIYLFVAMFWALFDQTGSSWVLQAQRMDRVWLGIEWLPSQIQAINPILIMAFIPLFSFVIYPALNKVFPLTPLRKISIGLFVTVPAFLIPAWIEMQLTNGIQPNIVWQLLAYAIITAAEVFVSITCLEFSYTQAPKKMKSFVMAFFLMSVSFGNLFVAVVNFVIQDHKVISKSVTKGELTVTPKKTTQYSLSCTQPRAQSWACKQSMLKMFAKCDDHTRAARKSLTIRIERKIKSSIKRPSSSLAANGKTDKIVIAKGGNVELSWSSKNTKSCTLDGKKIATSGKQSVTPTKDTTYKLSCVGTNEKTVKSDVKVLVGHPSIVTWTGNGTANHLAVRSGSKVTLAWASINTKECELNGAKVGVKGSKVVKPSKTELYVLACTGTNGKKVGSKVRVKIDDGVRITSFAANGKTSWNYFPGKDGALKTFKLTWATDKAKVCTLKAQTNRLSGAAYYVFFAGMMLLTAVLFIFVAVRYQEKTYIQDEEDAEEALGTTDDSIGLS